jgi:superfamily II DNA or RNA helicase
MKKTEHNNDDEDDISIYLGNKGYTIYKEALPKEELDFLREELTVRAYVPKSPVQPPSFPVYKESYQKIYIPRFFGMKHYGEPDAINIPGGVDIDIPFQGSLRDYQDEVVDIYQKKVGLKPANDGTPTHTRGGGGLLELCCGAGKTVMALNIISKVGKKTLVVVHKGFLLNQWVERIQQFLPTAKIGRIQGKVIDIEGKDIVIGMLQSLSMKDYPKSVFESFGLIVVDEVHHISSEVFSRSLTKIVTKYTLGLSATMNRKDGLTKVFKMFLGEIMYQKKRDGEDNVLVKAIDYKIDDDEFNEMEYDYRGNPKYSTMISKLCGFGRRSDFIVDVIQNEFKVNPDQQMIVLAHNKNLLTYLHDAVEHRGFATVGYYVGGMKDKDLKISETKKVIIATYAMAAEALDIKTLTTLLMATPKTDITQAVGRILRAKHSQPVVIDIIDQHEIFQRQWNKRRVYFKKQKYTIQRVCGYDNYVKDKWTMVFDPVTMKSCARKKKTGSSSSEKITFNRKGKYNKSKNNKNKKMNLDLNEDVVKEYQPPKHELLKGKCLIQL